MVHAKSKRNAENTLIINLIFANVALIVLGGLYATNFIYGLCATEFLLLAGHLTKTITFNGA